MSLEKPSVVEPVEEPVSPVVASAVVVSAVVVVVPVSPPVDVLELVLVVPFESSMKLNVELRSPFRV